MTMMILLRHKVTIICSCYCYVTADQDDTFEHFVNDMIIAAFAVFLFAMIAFHCYLKNRQRMKSELKMKSFFEFEEMMTCAMAKSITER